MAKFLNIFSKSKIQEQNNKETIIADNREKNSLIISHLIESGNKVEFKQLEIADYVIKDIAVERKTFSDFKNSIINKRLINQLLNLKQYPKNLLILEGKEDENLYSGKMHENAVRGFLLSTALKLNIPIIQTQNEKDTSKYLSILANNKSKNKEYSLRESKKFISKQEQLQFILEGFPNIGPIKAKKLIESFKSLKNIANAPKEDLEKVLGSQTENFIEILN